MELKQFDRRRCRVNAAVNLCPDADDVIYNLGRVLHKSGRLTEAAMLSIARLKSIRRSHRPMRSGKCVARPGRSPAGDGTLFPRDPITPTMPRRIWNLSLTQCCWAISSTAGPTRMGTQCESLIGQVSSKNHVGPGELLEGRTFCCTPSRDSATPSSSRATCQWWPPERQDHPASSARTCTGLL